MNWNIPPSFRSICVDKKPKWLMKNGKTILISNMDNRHLINTIKMLHRAAPSIRANYERAAWSLLCSVQGEMAEMCAESEIRNAQESCDYDLLMSACDSYKYLIDEASKRSLITIHYEDEPFITINGEP